MLITVAATTAIWVTVTLLTAPEPREKLLEFYRLVRPYPTFWRPIARAAPEVRSSSSAGQDFLNWAAGCGLIYGALFGTGKLLLKETAVAFGWLGLAAVCGFTVHRAISGPGSTSNP